MAGGVVVKRAVRLATVLLVLLLLVGAVALVWRVRSAANVPAAREQQLVYDVWAYAGEQYRSIFYPRSVDTLFLIANADNIVSPKLTEVYYWPLTFEYRADWQALDKRLTGVLEISRGGRVVASLEPTTTALVYDSITPRQVVVGAAAEQAYRQYLAESKTVSEAQDRYARAVADYQAVYEQYLQQLKAGNTNALPPQPPGEPPALLNRYVSLPAQAYAINLPPGDYELRLRVASGATVTGSRKKLHVFAPRRQGVGYTAFVAERWTEPALATDPQAVLYLRPGEDLYLEPFTAREFPRYDYARLLAPQQPAVGKGSWEWVLAEPVTGDRLQLLRGNTAVATVDQQPFLVKQTEGAALGYTIVPYDAASAQGSRPSFTAFRLPPAGGDASRIRIVGPDGQPLLGSERRVQGVPPANSVLLYLLSTVPPLLGLALLMLRRRPARGAVPAEQGA